MTIELPDDYLHLKSDGSSTADVAKLVKRVMKSDEDVTVSSLKGGITNQLLLAEQNGVKVLVRAFGKGTSSFIDRKREYAVHQQLQKLNLAPKLYGQFKNGLIYGFVPGKPALASELTELPVIREVSRRLAQWHACLPPQVISEQLSGNLGDVWSVLEQWVELCPKNVIPMSSEDLKAEFTFLKGKLAKLSPHEVMGHCDLLSANILLPDSATSCLPLVPRGTDPEIISRVASTVAFIDYEYAIPCPRAFDIANHFQEWQGYECDKSRVPEPTLASPLVRAWCTEYLTAYSLLTNTEPDYEALVAELQAFWGIPGFYWGVWSAIQSSTSDIDFDYSEYAKTRFQEYLNWKQKWLPTLAVA